MKPGTLEGFNASGHFLSPPPRMLKPYAPMTAGLFELDGCSGIDEDGIPLDRRNLRRCADSMMADSSVNVHPLTLMVRFRVQDHGLYPS